MGAVGKRAGIRKVCFPEESRSIFVQPAPRFTLPHEVQALCWLARQIPGDILEMGCNDGRTTRELALNFPERRVLAVDFAEEDDTLCPEQKGEKPPPEEIALFADGFPNVQVFNLNSRKIKFARKPFFDVRFIFVDGDHSYAGVKADTEIALTHLKRQCEAMIVWHDFHDDCPEWMKVYAYVTREIAQCYQVEWIDTTRLAVLRFARLPSYKTRARHRGSKSLA